MTDLTRTAIAATAHCLTGCAIGEVAGLAIGTALGWGAAPTIVLAVGLAFVFGYAFTMAVAFAAAVPVNRWLIARGRGHAVVHGHHAHGL